MSHLRRRSSARYPPAPGSQVYVQPNYAEETPACDYLVPPPVVPFGAPPPTNSEPRDSAYFRTRPSHAAKKSIEKLGKSPTRTLIGSRSSAFTFDTKQTSDEADLSDESIEETVNDDVQQPSPASIQFALGRDKRFSFSGYRLGLEAAMDKRRRSSVKIFMPDYVEHPRPSMRIVDEGDISSIDEKASSIAPAPKRKIYIPPAPEIMRIDVWKYSVLGRILLHLAPITCLLSVGASVYYLSLRARYTSESMDATGKSFASAWIFFAIEVIFAAFAGVTSFWHSFNIRTKETTKLRLRPDLRAPPVDILIICSGEDPTVVMDCVVATARCNYPVDKFHVFVIDDTNSPIIQKRVQNFTATRARHVSYHKRTQGKPGIAGAINFGLTETKANDRVPAEFTVVLQAHALPEPDMLCGMIPHLIDNPRVGLVRCQTGVYNLPTPLSDFFTSFMNIIEPVEASRGGFAMRRQVCEEIGGFPTRSSIEDNQMSIRIAGKGYETIFLDECLQYGLVADTFSDQLQACVARHVARLRTARKMKFLLFNKSLTYMPFTDRLWYLGWCLAPLLSFVTVATAILFPVSLFMGGFLVPVLDMKQLNMLIWCYAGAFLAQLLHEFIFNSLTDKPSASRRIQLSAFIAPYDVIAIISSIWRRSSEPGSSNLASIPQERSGQNRTAFKTRLFSILFESHGWVQFALGGFLWAGVLYSFIEAVIPYAKGLRGLHATGLLLLLTIAWPSLFFIHLALGSAIPFFYAISPPTVPNREQLVHREAITGVCTPLMYRHTRPFHGKRWVSALIYFLIFTYVVVVFALSLSHVQVPS